MSTMLVSLIELTDDQLRHFADACSDPQNSPARQVMLAAGANSASGVIARIMLATGSDRQHLIDLVRCAIGDRSSDRKAAESEPR